MGKGRPTKLTQDVVEDICSAISIGAPYNLAALYAKISYPTLQNWLKLARDARKKQDAGGRLTTYEKRLLDFLRQVDEASGEAGITWQKTIHQAAKNDPVWAKYMLERRFPETQPASVQYVANIDITQLSDEQLRRIAAGENPADVITTSGGGGSGVTTASENNGGANG